MTAPAASEPTPAPEKTPLTPWVDRLVHPRSWTMGAKIVASLVALFFVITSAIGVTTILLGRAYLNDQLDASILASVQRTQNIEGIGPLAGEGAPPPGERRGYNPGFSGDEILRVVINQGSIQTDNEGNPMASASDFSGRNVVPSTDEVEKMVNAGLGATPRTVDLGHDLGNYRLCAFHLSNGNLLITGMPTSGVDRIVQRLVLLVTGGTGLGLGLVTLGGRMLVHRNLKPLERMAATARRVSTLKLDTGDVAVMERVDPRDTDPRTEVGAVGSAFNRMLDNVDGALQSRHESEMRVRQFVADASHELRTPLASIRGYAELSRRETEPVPASVTHALGRVESEALRMTSLVEDLLLLARLDEGRPLDQEEVDLTMLAVDAVSDAHAVSCDHVWALDLPDDPVTVIGDKARLTQVLANLLANARTHTPKGTEVITAIAREGDQVRLSVTDNGPGIPESLQRNVFERFTRGDDSRSRAAGSTGLGLSIVAAVGQAHGGSVDVESRPGRTRFSVLLPA